MRPHDLLRIKSTAVLAPEVPEWARDALHRVPYVVVRRDESVQGLVPVGVRGTKRDQRHAAWVANHDVVATVTPESLAVESAWRACERRQMPVFAAFERVADAAAEMHLVWGPGGSAGFELATGVETVTAASDLDIIVRPGKIHRREDLEQFQKCLDTCDVRVDAVIEAEAGAVALREWLMSPDRLLIKTPAGPRLGTFAW